MRQSTLSFAKKQRVEEPSGDEQDKAVAVARSGGNLFITGSGGVGKSYTLRRIIDALSSEHGKACVFVTASTGIAATHVGGTTLHYFAGIGLGQGTLEQCLTKVRKNKEALARWRAAKVLIVDEVSMIAPAYFCTLDAVARRLRKRLDEPFGGIQVIVCGDFLQLPPVEQGEPLFEIALWATMFPRPVLLRRIRRQEDQVFIDLLQAVRKGTLTQAHVDLLQSRCGRPGADATRLYTHRNDVAAENDAQMARIPGRSYVYKSQDSALSDALMAVLDKSCQASAVITLKVGAQVVLLKNLDFKQSLVNGSRGVVVDFVGGDPQAMPVVKFACGVAQPVDLAEWKLESGDLTVASRRQLPLALCWASTIHKSMGMTLDAVEVSLRNVFEYGQAYVALSRCSTLEGLTLLDLDVGRIRAEPRAVQYYTRLESAHK